jgi:tetratricopeptide (TPR) repeat protein
VADVLNYIDRLEEATEVAERAFAGLPDGSLERAEAAERLAAFYAFAGDVDRAFEASEAALSFAEPLQAWETIAQALMTRAITLTRRGREQEAIALISHALQIALRHDLPAVALRAYNNIANSAVAMDRLDDAAEDLDRGLALARARGDRRWEELLRALEAHVLAMLGRWDEVIEGGVPVVETRGLAALAVLPSVARVQAGRGDLEGLERTGELAAEWLGSANMEFRAAAVVAQTIVANAQGRPEEALELGAPVAMGGTDISAEDRKDAYLEACQAALTLGERDRLDEFIAHVEGLPPGAAPPSLRAEATRFAGLLAASDGDVEGGLRRLRAASATLRELGCRFLLAQALVEQGELLRQADRGDEAAPLVQEARGIFAELRAVPWLERAERALASAPA